MSFKVIGIGEVLWDLLPSGPQLGGAPANFAFHAHQLGATAAVITRVGRDDYGREIRNRFAAMGIGSSTMQQDETSPTGTAAVQLDADGVPRFHIVQDAAWDHLRVTDDALAACQQAHAVCFGSLAQRTASAASTIQQLVAAASFSSLKVYDVNLRERFYTVDVIRKSCEIANVIKLNDYELGVLSPMFGLTGTARQKVAQLSRQFDLDLVALTRGENGSLLYQAGQCVELNGRPVNIVDTVGAGDAFTAALVMGLLHGFSLEHIHRVAVAVAGYVCSRPGGTPVLPEALLRSFGNDGTQNAMPAATAME